MAQAVIPSQYHGFLYYTLRGSFFSFFIDCLISIYEDHIVLRCANFKLIQRKKGVRLFKRRSIGSYCLRFVALAKLRIMDSKSQWLLKS